MKELNDKCEWKEELVDGSPEKYVKTGLIFHSCNKFDWHIIEYNLTSGGKMKKCFHCGADIRKPESLKDMTCDSECGMRMKYGVSCEKHDCGYIRPVEPPIDEREEKFEKWWNDNLSSQPPLINSNDSPNMIAKNYCRIGFYGCYELQESQK